MALKHWLRIKQVSLISILLHYKLKGNTMKWFIATNSMQNSLFNIQHTFYLKGSDNVSQRLFLSHIKYIEGQRLLPATSTLNTDKRKSHIMLMYKGHNIEKLYSNEFVHGKGEYKSDPACSRSYSNDCLFLVFINISRHGSMWRLF